MYHARLLRRRSAAAIPFDYRIAFSHPAGLLESSHLSDRIAPLCTPRWRHRRHRWRRRGAPESETRRAHSRRSLLAHHSASILRLRAAAREPLGAIGETRTVSESAEPEDERGRGHGRGAHRGARRGARRGALGARWGRGTAARPLERAPPISACRRLQHPRRRRRRRHGC